MYKLAISYEPEERDEIDRTKIIVEDGDLLVMQVEDGLADASVPREKIITVFDGGAALGILENENIGNALLGHMPLSPGGEAEVAASLQRFAKEGRQIVFWVNRRVAQELGEMLEHAKIKDKYLILDKLGGINPRCLAAEMRRMFPEIFPSFPHRFNSSPSLRAKKA